MQLRWSILSTITSARSLPNPASCVSCSILAFAFWSSPSYSSSSFLSPSPSFLKLLATFASSLAFCSKAVRSCFHCARQLCRAAVNSTLCSANFLPSVFLFLSAASASIWVLRCFLWRALSSSSRVWMNCVFSSSACFNSPSSFSSVKKGSCRKRSTTRCLWLSRSSWKSIPGSWARYSKGMLLKKEAAVSARASLGLLLRFCMISMEYSMYGGVQFAIILMAGQGGQAGGASGWQRAAFGEQLRLLLGHIAGEALNFLQFQLLAQQARIFFVSPEDETRCRRLFGREGQVRKRELMRLVSLEQVRVEHTQQQFVVRLRRSREELMHSRALCFRFWKQRMAVRYGHVHEWFEALCQERDIRRVALPRFLAHLERILQDTPHRHCGKTVSLAFAKTRKNEVELSVFMNTILIDSKASLASTKSALAETILGHSRAKSAVLSTARKGRYDREKEQKQDGKQSTAACSSNKAAHSSLREIVSSRSMSKYLTPKVKIKTLNSFLVVE